MKCRRNPSSWVYKGLFPWEARPNEPMQRREMEYNHLACSEEEACSSQERVIDWHQHHMVSLRMPMGTDNDGRDRARRVPFCGMVFRSLTLAMCYPSR